jgi:PAS domain S-box-containing protein
MVSSNVSWNERRRDGRSPSGGRGHDQRGRAVGPAATAGVGGTDGAESERADVGGRRAGTPHTASGAGQCGRHERDPEHRIEDLASATDRLEEQEPHLFEGVPVMAVVTRTEDRRPIIEECNRPFAGMLGYEKADVGGEELAAFHSPESRRTLLEDGGYYRALVDGIKHEERELVTADGEIVETLVRAVPRREMIGAVLFYVDERQ